MDERIKRDIIMFLAVLISCLIFARAVETFTGVLSETRERNLENARNIKSIYNILDKNKNSLDSQEFGVLGFYDDFFPKEFF